MVILLFAMQCMLNQNQEWSHKLQNRRDANRISVHRTATVTHRDLRTKLKCIIDDLSSTGAHLRFSVPSDIPDAFMLSIPCDNIRVEVDVRWRGIQECGVQFKQSFAHPLLTIHRMQQAAA